MAVYYIDPQNGTAENGGLLPEYPVKRETDITLQPGDTVLFKRGSFIRDFLHNVNGEDGNPITYAAYGEGEKPVFCGSVDCSDPTLWTEIAPNVWSTDALNSELGNIVFNNGEYCGTLRWTANELTEQGDFFDNSFGCSEQHLDFPKTHRVYLYSEKNPGEYYSHIECVIYGNRILATAGQNQIIRDLCFTHSGVHAIAGAANCRNFKVENCDFSYIGGCAWNGEMKIRFGNGVEMWDTCDNVEVIGCTFDEIYDSAVTHQGYGRDCKQADRLIIRNNSFSRCGMAAYEQRDKMPLYAEFCQNTCLEAGNGFSKNGEVMPRSSEIWPQPMGHHIFLWRIDVPDEQGKLIIADNNFGSAVYGAAIYSIICRESENQLTIQNNRYSGQMLLTARMHGNNYESLQAFATETGFERE